MTPSGRPWPSPGQRIAGRLVANLADNAVRHNVPHGRAGVVTGTGAGYAMVSADQVARIFQPFQRLAPNGRRRPGTGWASACPSWLRSRPHTNAPVQAIPLRAGGLAVTAWFPSQPRAAGHIQQPATHQPVGSLAGAPA